MRKLFLLLVITMTLLVFLAIQDYPTNKNWFKRMKVSEIFGLKRDSVTEKSQKTDDAEMFRRLKTKEKACQRLKKVDDLEIIRKKRNFHYGLVPCLIYLPKYNLSTCSIGKIGGTFLKQVLMIIRKGVNFSSHLETLRRIDTHTLSNELYVPRKTEKWKRAKVMNIARNPYTRLFSAYVDRVTVPSTTDSIRNGSKCTYDVTFNEFLRIVLRNTKQGKMDSHWSPVYFLCLPCEEASTFIAKQESFSSNMKYVLDNLDLPLEKRKLIDKKLSSSRNTWTTIGIAKNVFSTKNKIFLDAGCAGWFGIIKNLWKAFQIQGYIDKNIDLPTNIYNKTEDFSNVDSFLNIVFATMKKYPLSKEERLRQRHDALVEAYSEVEPETIEEIKRLYRPDFELFGYAVEPPSA